MSGYHCRHHKGLLQDWVWFLLGLQCRRVRKARSYSTPFPGRILRSTGNSQSSSPQNHSPALSLQRQEISHLARHQSRHHLLQQRYSNSTFLLFLILRLKFKLFKLFFFSPVIENAREAPFPVSFPTYDLSSITVSIKYDVLKLGI